MAPLSYRILTPNDTARATRDVMPSPTVFVDAEALGDMLSEVRPGAELNCFINLEWSKADAAAHEVSQKGNRVSQP